MSQQDVTDKGYPRSNLKRDWEYIKLCGGFGGGGDCQVQLGKTKVVYAIDVNPFAVFNRNLILQNPLSGGIRIYSDAGVSGICSSSLGSERSWYLAFGATNALTDAQIVAQNNILSGAPAYNIEVGFNKLPQPTDPSWASKIYVYIYWGDTTFINSDLLLVNDVQYLKMLKLDQDIKL